MERPQRLTAAFVEKIDQPGRYSDGPGSHGLTLLVRPRKDGMSKNWAQQLRVNGKLRSFGLGSFPPSPAGRGTDRSDRASGEDQRGVPTIRPPGVGIRETDG